MYSNKKKNVDIVIKLSQDYDDVQEIAKKSGLNLRTVQRYVSEGLVPKLGMSTSPRVSSYRAPASYRERFFAHNGPGPYACVFCDRDVVMDEVQVHHVDHDRKNNVVTNLAPCHVRCHTSYHQRLRWDIVRKRRTTH